MEKAQVLEIVRRLVEEGKFGGAGEMVSLEPEKGATIGAQTASELSFLELTVRRPSGQTELIPVVVKLQFPDPEITPHDLVACFNNEVLLYKDVLPAINTRNIQRYPNVYYCYSNGGKDFSKDIIIMKNLKTKGFSLRKHKVFLDFDHVSIALKALGQYHAWSYKYKSLNKDMLFKLQGKFIISNKSDDVSDAIVFESMNIGIQPFLEKGIETNLLKTFLKCAKKPDEVQKLLWKPDDVFSVIIHGDFNNNNILYKYDEKGIPIDVALFDFQFAKYSSPAIDLSFFLYMNTDKDLREKHWDDFLRIYWEAVEENTPEEVSLPGYEDFLKHFASRAVYGYFPSSFFISMMLNEDNKSLKEMAAKTHEEILSEVLSIVNKYKQYNIDIVSHLLEHGYMHSFIDLYNGHLS